MAGRHSAKTSKAPIVIVFAIILLIVAVGVVVFFMNSKNSDISETQPQQLASTEVQATEIKDTQSQIIEEITTIPVTEEQGVTSAETVPIDIIVPTQQGAEVSYFEASYSPVKAVDSSTGNECSLSEVFGSSYSGGAITFYSDGTFLDLIISSRGAYVVSGETISATYVNDKNMDITVNSWNDNIPSDFIINYGGYDVYFEG